MSEFGDFYSDNPYERYMAHQAAKGRSVWADEAPQDRMSVEPEIPIPPIGEADGFPVETPCGSCGFPLYQPAWGVACPVCRGFWER